MGAYSHFVTAPLIEFKSLENGEFVSSFCNSLELNTFDIPTKPSSIIYRLGFKFCGILFFVQNQFKLEDDPRKILQYEISWSTAPDIDELNDVAIINKADDFDKFDEEIPITSKHKKSKKKKSKKEKKVQIEKEKEE